MDTKNEDIITEKFEYEDWDCSILQGEIHKFNGSVTLDGKIVTTRHKRICLTSYYRQDTYDEDGEFAGYGGPDQETGVQVDFNANEAEALAHWLLAAAKEVREHIPEPKQK